MAPLRRFSYLLLSNTFLTIKTCHLYSYGNIFCAWRVNNFFCQVLVLFLNPATGSGAAWATWTPSLRLSNFETAGPCIKIPARQWDSLIYDSIPCYNQILVSWDWEEAMKFSILHHWYPIACAVPATQASTSYKLTYYALRVAAHYSGLILQFSPIKPCFLHDHWNFPSLMRSVLSTYFLNVWRVLNNSTI